MFSPFSAAFNGSNGAPEALKWAGRPGQICDAELTMLTTCRHYDLPEVFFPATLLNAADRFPVGSVSRKVTGFAERPALVV